MVAERGDLIDQATDIVEQMLDDVVAVAPTRPQGRRPGAAVGGRLPDLHRGPPASSPTSCARATNEPFTETAVDGIPISDKLERFAADNEMPACAPPLDTSN